jgi:hypothetical protein
MLRAAVLGLLLLSACSKKPADPAAGSGSGSGSATVTPEGSGSAGSGSGSGSAMAGSGSGSADAGSGSGSAAAGSGSGSGSGTAADATPFDKLDHDAKVAVMKKEVIPAMREAFVKFDAKEYPKLTCKTCHGKDPDATKYKMPNPELPKLDFAALKAGKQHPKTAEFMGKTVTPEMAKILHLPEYSETNPTGFGCLGCHEQKK